MNKIVQLDIKEMANQVIKYRPSSKCLVCSSKASIRSLHDTYLFCVESGLINYTTSGKEKKLLDDKYTITFGTFADNRSEYALVDVRSEVQYNICNLPDSTNIPYDNNASFVGDMIALLKKEQLAGTKKLVLVCRRGVFSLHALIKLITEDATKELFEHNIYHLHGGLLEYSSKYNDKFPIY